MDSEQRELPPGDPSRLGGTAKGTKELLLYPYNHNVHMLYNFLYDGHSQTERAVPDT